MEGPFFIFLDTIVDFFFFLDIVAAFRTTYYDPTNGEEVTNSKLIAKNYIKKTFVIDLLATIPFDKIALVSQHLN